MMFMNEYEVDLARDMYYHHPILGPATKTLENLVYWTNTHSDGWPYWSKPCRASAKLQLLIQRESNWHLRADADAQVTEAEYKAALKPIKAFRTRQKADFEIVEVI